MNPYENKADDGKNKSENLNLDAHSHKNEKIEMHKIDNEHDFSSAKYHEPFLNENNLPVYFFKNIYLKRKFLL